MKKILIIGGYGNFGQFIAKILSKEPDIHLIIAGRDAGKAKKFAQTLTSATAIQIDIHRNLSNKLQKIMPDIVIHTSGPYQSQDYSVARACINHNCHYIDLADGRDYVSGIHKLDPEAKLKNIVICSGASSVPCLTSAVIDYYKPEFHKLRKIDCAIATAQKTSRGLATLQSVLSYAGKPFKTLRNGEAEDIYGWSDLEMHKFWQLGRRFLGNCDIPDLEIFPERYPELQEIRFKAGIEVPFLHFMMMFLSWLVKIKLLKDLTPLAPFMMKMAGYFDRFGSNQSGFKMDMLGIDPTAKERKISFQLVAKNGDGVYIPTMPAILMAIKLSRDDISYRGAKACTDFITLDEYLQALSDFDIESRVVKI